MTAGTLALGPFRVSVDADRAAAYRRETGCAATGVREAAPLGYPAVWLSSPDIRAAISRVCAVRDSVPVHESQSFAYAAPLQPGESYDLSLAMRQEEAPPRLIIEAALKTPAGEARASFETILRLIPRAGFKMGAPS